MNTIYILIMIFQSSSYGVPSSMAVEFNSLENCQAASIAIVGQLPNTTLKNHPVMVCAAKGVKK